MITLTELLKNAEFQELVLGKIIEALRARNEWGRRGLFAKIGRQFNVSPAYAGQVLNGKKELSLNFVEKIANYLNVSVVSLFEKNEMSNSSEQWGESITFGEVIREMSLEKFKSLLSIALDGTEVPENFYQLIEYFLKIPPENRKRAIDTLQLLQSGKLEITIAPGIKVKDL